MSPALAEVGARFFDHELYGLVLRADEAIETLPRTTARRPDVRFRFVESRPEVCPESAELEYESDARDHAGAAYLRLHRLSSGRVLEFVDGTVFLVDATEGRIDCWCPPGESRANAYIYLVGQAMSFLLRELGVVVLHGSASAIDGRAIAFLGPPGAGKSTVAAALAQEGSPLLTDDLVALRPRAGGFVVPPGYRGAKLWGDAAAALGSDAEPILERSDYWPDWDKRFMAHTGTSFCTTEQPLGGVFLLSPREPETTTPVRVRGHEAAAAILAHVSLVALPGAEARREQLKAVADLVRTTRVWRIALADDLAALAGSLRVIADTVAEADADV